VEGVGRKDEKRESEKKGTRNVNKEGRAGRMEVRRIVRERDEEERETGGNRGQGNGWVVTTRSGEIEVKE